MNALIVYASPEPDSFNGRMRSVAVETLKKLGYQTEICDLYAEGFDPLEGPRHYSSRADTQRFNGMVEQSFAVKQNTVSADVTRMIERLDRAQLLILQFPLWWYAVPAILKGWLDRVLVYGSVYGTEMRYDKGRFAGRRAMISVTCGGPPGSYDPNGRNGDVNMWLYPTSYTLAYIGYTVLPAFATYGVIPPGTPEQAAKAQAHLAATEERYRQHLLTLDSRPPLQFNKWGDWDANGHFKPETKIHNPFSRHV